MVWPCSLAPALRYSDGTTTETAMSTITIAITDGMKEWIDRKRKVAIFRIPVPTSQT
jgi:hypothetical protein